MGLRSTPQSCTDTSSQVPISGVVILGWRNLQSVREHTKQLALWTDILILTLEGARAIQHFGLKELSSAYDLLVSYMYLVGRAMTCMWNE